MIDTQTAVGWRGHELVDRDGQKIGTIAEIYLDHETREPEWATVKTGLFGTRQTFVPIRDAIGEGEIVRVPFEKDHVKDAPKVDPEQELSRGEERELYEHYGIEYSQSSPGTQLPEEGGGEAALSSEGKLASAGGVAAGTGVEGEPRAPAPEPGERGVAEPGESDADEESPAEPAQRDAPEDRATTQRVGEEPVAEGKGDGETRLRLKRYVVTEEVKVPVQREEVRLEREDD